VNCGTLRCLILMHCHFFAWCRFQIRQGPGRLAALARLPTNTAQALAFLLLLLPSLPRLPIYSVYNRSRRHLAVCPTVIAFSFRTLLNMSATPGHHLGKVSVSSLRRGFFLHIEVMRCTGEDTFTVTCFLGLQVCHKYSLELFPPQPRTGILSSGLSVPTVMTLARHSQS
jgi:hypothetical protein